MAEEIRADPQEMVRLAKATLAGADAMADAQVDDAPAEGAYGNAAAGPELAAAVAGAAAALDAAWRRLAGIYEGDADRLLGVAFAYQQADAEAARQHRAIR